MEKPVKKGLRIGEAKTVVVILLKATEMSMGSREHLDDVKLMWSLVFPECPLLTITSYAGVQEAIIYFTLFDNDEDLVEFKLRYL